jgi:hypothetical protein
MGQGSPALVRSPVVKRQPQKRAIVPVVVTEEKRRIQTFFRQVAQTRRVTFRMTENDFYSLQLKARQEGIPYQALITSILHKYLTGQLVPALKLDPEGKS